MAECHGVAMTHQEPALIPHLPTDIDKPEAKNGLN
jgi:hypothetical protein